MRLVSAPSGASLVCVRCLLTAAAVSSLVSSAYSLARCLAPSFVVAASAMMPAATTASRLCCSRCEPSVGPIPATSLCTAACMSPCIPWQGVSLGFSTFAVLPSLPVGSDRQLVSVVARGTFALAAGPRSQSLWNCCRGTAALTVGRWSQSLWACCRGTFTLAAGPRSQLLFLNWGPESLFK